MARSQRVLDYARSDPGANWARDAVFHVLDPDGLFVAMLPYVILIVIAGTTLLCTATIQKIPSVTRLLLATMSLPILIIVVIKGAMALQNCRDLIEIGVNQGLLQIRYRRKTYSFAQSDICSFRVRKSELSQDRYIFLLHIQPVGMIQNHSYFEIPFRSDAATVAKLVDTVLSGGFCHASRAGPFA